LPTWAKVGDRLDGIIVAALMERAYSASYLDLPFRQALATTRKEDRHCIG